MPALLPMLLAGSHLMLVADRVPQLNTDPNCHAAAAVSAGFDRSEDSCKRDESDARGKLEQEWTQFTSTQKTHCVSLANLGGPPSYVELLTCLEIAKAADNLPKEDRLGGLGEK